jgi:hypothetical protein
MYSDFLKFEDFKSLKKQMMDKVRKKEGSNVSPSLIHSEKILKLSVGLWACRQNCKQIRSHHLPGDI